MFRFSKKIDYTVLLITELVSNEREVIPASALAEKFSLSPDFIANLMKNLARNGFVESVRGKNGGYRISKNPDDVSLMDLIEAIEGPVSLTECSEDDHQLCQISSLCGSRVKMMEVSQEIQKVLDGVNLGEIVQANQNRYQFIKNTATTAQKGPLE